jgi:hypothetical protein
MSDLYGVSLVLVLEENLDCGFILPCKVINYFNTNSSHFASTPSTQFFSCRSTISLDQQKEMQFAVFMTVDVKCTFSGNFQKYWCLIAIWQFSMMNRVRECEASEHPWCVSAWMGSQINNTFQIHLPAK